MYYCILKHYLKNKNLTYVNDQHKIQSRLMLIFSSVLSPLNISASTFFMLPALFWSISEVAAVSLVSLSEVQPSVFLLLTTDSFSCCFLSIVARTYC